MFATTNPLTAARAEALFVSDLSVTQQPTGVVVEAAIKNALQTRGGVRGCAAEVAAAFGDYPELAVGRMRWARGIVEDLYEHRMPRRPHRAARLTGSGPRPTLLAHAA
jgi:hypothetical protein